MKKQPEPFVSENDNKMTNIAGIMAMGVALVLYRE